MMNEQVFDSSASRLPERICRQNRLRLNQVLFCPVCNYLIITGNSQFVANWQQHKHTTA
jgi:hypothetical protein